MKIFNILTLLLLLPTFLLAQSNIAGSVTNTKGNPLIGVNVLVESSTMGTTTDVQGNYKLTELQAQTEYILRFSYVGYEEKVMRINTGKVGETVNLSVQMSAAAVDLEELYVTATRAADDAPFAFSNVDEEAIEKQNLGQDVPFVLRFTPSAVVTSDAGTGIGYTGIRIRGVEPTGINVTINGIPLNDSESQGVFWVNMPDFSSSTSSIQIQRGVGTSTNGAGAFGATVNLSTGDSQPEAFTELNGTVGSFGTLKANVEFGSGMLNDKFSFGGRASTITSDGYIDRASVDLNSYFLTGAYHGEKSLLRFNTFAGHEVTYQAWNGVPVQWVEDDKLRTYNSAGTNKAGEPHDNEVDDYTQRHYQLLYSRDLSDNFDLSLAGHYTRGFGFFEQYESDVDYTEFGLENPTIIDTTISNDLIQRRWLDNHFYGATYNLSYHSANNKFQSTLGGAWNTYTGDHFGEIIWARYAGISGELGDEYYDNVGEKTDFNVYLKTGYELTDGLSAFVDLQYRDLAYSIDGIDKDGRDITQSHDYQFFNPKLGLSYELKNNLQMYASFAVANREPNRGDFTDVGDVNGDGVADVPMHETLYDTEIGVRKAWKNAALNANFYYMDYENALIPTGQLNDVGATVRTNVPTAYRAGIELVGGIKATDWLEFNANATFSQNRIESFTEYIDNWSSGEQETVEHSDTDLALSPSIIQSAELVFHTLPNVENQDLSISLIEKFVGKQYLDNTSNEDATLPAYAFLNAGVQYSFRPQKLVKEIGVNFSVQNLTNAQFSTAGWIYRFRSPDYNPVADDPSARTEGLENQYNLTGLYPQAGTNFLLAVKIRF